MAELTTIREVEAELAATADYDVADDVDKARRRVVALRRKLDFPQEIGRGETNLTFALQIIENQLRQALAFVASKTDQSSSDRLNDPDVTHADFSTFRGYQ